MERGERREVTPLQPLRRYGFIFLMISDQNPKTRNGVTV